MRRILIAIILLLSFALPSSAAESSAESRPRFAPSVIDNGGRIDVNRVSMFLTNTGSFASDRVTFNSGLEFPKGSSKTAVYAAGLWLGASVGGQTRVVLSEYDDEYVPGAMIGGVADDRTRPEYKVYRLNRVYASTVERDAALADYTAGAVPHGAPLITVQLDGSLDVPGDQMTWCVFNDADPNQHHHQSGRTAPLGVEIQETFYEYDDPGPLGNTIFLRFKVINKGGNLLEQMHLGLWVDPDVGGATDDVEGSDPARAMGYAYNAYAIDPLYGNAAPAVGVDLLRGPLASPSGPRLGLTSFISYLNGQEPDDATKTYNVLQGLAQNGGPIIDPTTSLPTRYMFNGDPLAGTGWLDTAPADHRMLLGAGPFTMAPGDTQDVLYALILGSGINHPSSLADLRCDDDGIQSFFDRGETLPRPEQSSACLEIHNCAQPPAFWSGECPSGGGQLSAQKLQTIAGRIDGRSNFFNWGVDPVAGLCAALGSSATVRDEATREVATLLANVGASSPFVIPTSGQRIYLDPGTPVSCLGQDAVDVASLVTKSRLGVYLADYLDLNAAHPTPLAGVPLGGQGFGGGAGTAFGILGSSLDPAVHPDSFMTVEVRFDHTTTQMAYRFLRHEDPFGGTPFPGRFYDYAGFHTVPFTVWDVVNNVQLDAGFVERFVTTPGGDPLPPEEQPATYDSTWGPDTSATGGFEYLIVYRRAYSGSPNPQIAFDGAAISPSAPSLYFLHSRKIDVSAVIDDGDAFRFPPDVPFGPDLDSQMIHLGRLALSDPSVVAGYQSIIDCIGDINRNLGIGANCETTTPVLASLVSVDAEPDRVAIVWEVSGRASPVGIERRDEDGAWITRDRRSPDGAGRIAFEDASVTPGRRYGYRLRVNDGGVDQLVGETSVEVPSAAMLSLAGFRPNPALREARVAFSLATREPARIEVFDLAGRRAATIALGSLKPGSYVRTVGDNLASGVYVIRLTQGAHAITRKAALVR